MSDEAADAIRVSIVTGGRFHAFHLARELAHRNVLHRLIVSDLRSRAVTAGVPGELVHPCLWGFATERIVRRLSAAGATHAAPTLNRAMSWAASRELGQPTLVHGWAGYSLPSFNTAKKRGLRCVVERSSAHYLAQMELLREEHDRVGFPFRLASWSAHPDVDEYDLADAICVPSKFAMRTFLERGFPQEKLIYAPLGASLEHFSPGTKRDDSFRVMYAGSLSIQKGLHHLVAAFRIASLNNAELCLAGTSTAETEHLLRNSPRHVRRVGQLNEVALADLYRQSSVFVLPSVHDGFGMVLAQALASGLPIIGTRNTGAEDLLQLTGERNPTRDDNIDEYPAGYVVPIRSPGAIARVLVDLATKPELLNSKQQAARSARVSGLSWSDYGARVIDGYRSLQ
ncbi:MAG: hypothetical protein JWN04_759 [Myxococcaceae bacterium]|nr:hypothetical protein [Myxococcaceae bacterium]